MTASLDGETPVERSLTDGDSVVDGGERVEGTGTGVDAVLDRWMVVRTGVGTDARRGRRVGNVKKAVVCTTAGVLETGCG